MNLEEKGSWPPCRVSHFFISSFRLFCLPSKSKQCNSWFPRICRHIRSGKGVFSDIYVVAPSVCDRLIRRHRELESCAKEAANGGIGLSGGIRQQLSASAAAALLVISAGEENWLLNRVWVFPGFKMSCQNTESWLEARASSSSFFFFLFCGVIWDDVHSVMPLE